MEKIQIVKESVENEVIVCLSDALAAVAAGYSSELKRRLEAVKFAKEYERGLE